MYFQRGSGGPTGGWWIGTETEVAYESGECYRHDIAGWRRDRVPVKPSGRPVTIAPDWVAEILSPSNWRHDAVVKFDTCFRHRVGHFWSLDPENRILTVYRWHADGWLRVCAVTPRQRARLEPFDAVEFEVAVLFGDDPGPEPAVIVGQARTPSGFGSGT
jgi:Uma2 family endonuclease